jgi:hypothetical protein
MEILILLTDGEYGERHTRNIFAHKPDNWTVEVWKAPIALPPIIDYPEDYLPGNLMPADLLISFAEFKGVAELIPEIVKITGSKSVIAAVDNEAWLPRGLARQLIGWLEDLGVPCATPKPLCSLTQIDYKVTRRERVAYESPYIAEFAKYFGQPDLDIQVNPNTRRIVSVKVNTDAVCGCARYVADGIVGMGVDEVEEKAGLLHHHYPCLASMVKLNDYNHDTLMHESGHLLVENISKQVKPFKSTRYIVPGV